MTATLRSDERAHVALELQRRHPDVAPARVDALVAAAFDAFSDAPVRQFVPLLVARQVEERLRADVRAS